MSMNEEINWRAEQDRFMAVAYERTVASAHAAFRGWHPRKRDDAVAEMVGKMWDQWARLFVKGKNPVPMIGPLIHWAKMWVRHDRKIAGRARSFDVQDYRANLTRHHLSGQGKASPTDRSDPGNGWIEWGLSDGDDPAELVAALEAVGLTCAVYAA